MTEPDPKSYHGVLLRSRLVEAEVIDRVLDELQMENGLAAVSGLQLSERLMSLKLLTPWQDQKMRQGLYQGFFLGKYKLLGPLGSGGMAKVYLAEHIQMRRPVALKILPPALVENASYLKRFYQEARATAALDHPNIVKAYDIDQEGSLHFLVMEYVEGQEMQKSIDKDGPLGIEQAADYIRQAAEGLAHAHDRGMIHRDIKPGNLVVDTQGVLKILDMGVARISGQSDAESLTLAHNEDVLGTVDYLAPEQVLDSHNVDPRADLYSLGCTLYFMLVGHPPYPEGSMAVRLMKHQTEEPAPIAEKRPEVPKSLIEICKKMMAKKREKRYGTAGELATVLAEWLKAQKSPAMPVAEPVAEAVAEPVDMAAPSRGNEKESIQALLARLAGEGILTKYQIEVLGGASDKPLSVDDYQILDRIDSGRLAGMYRARHRELHFPVCLNLVRCDANDPQRETTQNRFQREARISTQLNHANVVRTYQMGQSGDAYFLTIENLVGRSLFELLASGAKLSIPDACRFVRDAANGLVHLHEQEIVHRDVSPHNLWVNENRQVKLMGLGLASDSLSHLDGPGIDVRPKGGPVFLSAPEYLAPEVAADFEEASTASDIYGLGCTLYHALTGRPPFVADSEEELARMHAQDTAVPPSKLVPEIPQQLDQLIARMLAKAPTARPRTAMRVAETLEALASVSEAEL